MNIYLIGFMGSGKSTTGKRVAAILRWKFADIDRLVERLKSHHYRSRLIRRKYIPKGNGKERPLGIPVVEDRLLQAAVRLLLEAIYEQDFLPISYGYRSGVGAQQAVQDLTCELQFGR